MKPWKDMSEARAQLLADAIELAKRSSASKMIGQRGDFIPPEPKRETVRLTGYLFKDGDWAFSPIPEKEDTHAITFPTIDGKPVTEKCPHCGTAPIDLEELG